MSNSYDFSLTVQCSGEPLRLPAAKKTRALLAYMLLTMRPHRRRTPCGCRPPGATAPLENAARFVSAFGDIDVRDKLACVSVPTLVIHSAGDQRIPVSSGRDIAASIPNAEFVSVDSDDHLLLGRESASQVFLDAVERFIQ